MTKIYITGIFSIFALILYSLPWIYDDAHKALGFYILSFLWFMVAWMIIFLHLIFIVKSKKAKNNKWKHHLLSSVLIVISYVGLFILIINGFMLTV